MFIKDKGAVVQVIDFEARSPGVVQPFLIQSGGVSLGHRIVPDSIVQHQGQHPVDRCLHRPFHRQNRTLLVNFIGFAGNEVLRQVKQGDHRRGEAEPGEKNHY